MIDFDSLFKREILALLKEGKDPEQLEEEYPDIYLKWLDTPHAACGGVSPNAYFAAMKPEQLMAELAAYVSCGKAAPDSLLFAAEDAPGMEPLLYDAFLHGDSVTLRCLAADLLNQRQSALPLPQYLELLKAPGDKQLCELAAAGLEQQGEAAKELLIHAAEQANDEGALLMLDLLCALAPDERVFALLKLHFVRQEHKRAELASLLSRYGDERALPLLEQAIAGTDYMEYRAICDAIEALGGIVEEDRDFSGDPYYERLKIQNDETEQ